MNKILNNLIKNFKVLKWPSKHQWGQFFRTLSKKEIFLVWLLSGIILITAVSWFINFYLKNTQTVPAVGGKYKEGIIGQIRYLNPVLSFTNDADRDISQIVFSSLLKYNQDGQLIFDLAQSYEVKEDGKVFEFFLKENARWHKNDKPVSADDVIFTVNLMSDPNFSSPQRLIWQGIQIEKINDFGVRLKLPTPYAFFLHNLTFGILPKHIWQSINAADFALSSMNFKPIGSGPYQFKSLKRDEKGRINEIVFERNPYSYLAEPKIKEVSFNLYASEEEGIKALLAKEIDGLSYLSPQNKNKIENSSFQTSALNLNIERLDLDRYFTVFFNAEQNGLLGDKNIRSALNKSKNIDRIIKEVLLEEGKPIAGPMFLGSDIQSLDCFCLDEAKKILANIGFTDKDNNGFLERESKDGLQPLEIALTLPISPEIESAANILKNSWEEIGFKIDLELLSLNEIQDKIKTRNYQALIFGQVLAFESDPFSFWHSSQKRYPGLNLAMYDNKEADKILQQTRQILDPDKRKENYLNFQKILKDDLPSIFLYQPNYLWPISKKIKGAQIKKVPLPSWRFSQIENWYIKTDRVWK